MFMYCVAIFCCNMMSVTFSVFRKAGLKVTSSSFYRLIICKFFPLTSRSDVGKKKYERLKYLYSWLINHDKRFDQKIMLSSKVKGEFKMILNALVKQ